MIEMLFGHGHYGEALAGGEEGHAGEGGVEADFCEGDGMLPLRYKCHVYALPYDFASIASFGLNSLGIVMFVFPIKLSFVGMGSPRHARDAVHTRRCFV